MDPISLATAIVNFLSPMLPFLVKGGEAIAEEVSKDTWSTAKAIWSKLFVSSESENRVAALKTAEAVAVVPNNEALKTVWKEELKKLFESDLNLANDLVNLIGKDKSFRERGDSLQFTILGNDNKTIGTIHGQNVDVNM
jgi:hypothetical protein